MNAGKIGQKRIDRTIEPGRKSVGSLQLVDNRKNIFPSVQRKILKKSTNTESTANIQTVKKALNKDSKDCFKFLSNLYLVLREDFDKAIVDALQSEDKILYVDDNEKPIDGSSFVDNVTKYLGPNPENFSVGEPQSGKIGIETAGFKYKFAFVPNKYEGKKPGYVANIASYYKENGVTGITKKYFDDAISGEPLEKSKRLGVVVGLNSYSPIFEEDYKSTKENVSKKVSMLRLPDYPVNFMGFGFLWEPNWKLQNTHVSNFDLRWALANAPVAPDIKKVRDKKFEEKQKSLSDYYPYGVFRETVMDSNETQFLVDRLKNYNNPVYIHSGDGDSVSLKVPDDTDTATGTKGILDRMDEHLEEKGTGAKIVIGGYNLYNLDEQKLIVEIVKADSGITDYADGSKIDKEKPSVDLKHYSENDKALITAKVEQITHNTQVGNRYDRIIRDAISTVYPRMLYPTEPNMLVKAYDPSDHTDFFKTSFFDEEHRLKQQGSLWGMGASEGRVFKENLEREYEQEPESSGIGFVDWAKGASLPTDPRGFDRHLLISGYERYPDIKRRLVSGSGTCGR